MPRPRQRDAASTWVAPATADGVCVCGDDTLASFGPPTAVPVLADLDMLRAFWQTLRPAARASALKTTPAADVWPQIMEASGLNSEDVMDLVMQHMSNQALVDATCNFFGQALDGTDGTCGVTHTGQTVLLLPDAVLEAACTRVAPAAGGQAQDGPGLGTASMRVFGGGVPLSHASVPAKSGIVRCPVDVLSSAEGVGEVQTAAQQSICRPALGIHTRAWAHAGELEQYKQLARTCAVLKGVLTYLQRRLQRAGMRADAVRHMMSLGSAAASPSGQPPSVEAVQAAAAQDFQTWSWGAGAEGQLGHGSTKPSDGPTPIVMLAGTHVAQLSACYNHAFARTVDGDLLSWGASPLGVAGRHDQEGARTPLPLTVRASNAATSLVSTGHTHSLAVQHGRVLAWGAAWTGQLGHTENMTSGGCLLPFVEADFAGQCDMRPGMQFPPQYCKAMGWAANPDLRGCLSVLECHPVMVGPFKAPNRKSVRPAHPLQGVVSIAAGGMHSAAVTQDGSLHVWGSNEAAALPLALSPAQRQELWVQEQGCGCCNGRDSTVISVSSATRVPLDGVAVGRMVQVAAGSGITVALSDAGEVVSFGVAGKPPTRIDTTAFPPGETGAAVAAGGRWAMACTRPSGLVYVWARHHELEWGRTAEQQLVSKALPIKSWTPRKVPFLSHVTALDCSATHGIAATADGRVFWWPHMAVQGPAAALGDGHQFEVPALRNLHILCVAAGDNFGLVSTSPHALGDGQSSSGSSDEDEAVQDAPQDAAAQGGMDVQAHT